MWTASCSMWPTIPTSDMCCQFATTRGGASGRKTHTVEPGTPRPNDDPKRRGSVTRARASDDPSGQRT